ncbi:MAG TPA: hypothetical protein DCG06_04725 [Deltaproteobacteria bacterium]|nr:hypothetical protein [Deltaproteobacteria bacterium]
MIQPKIFWLVLLGLWLGFFTWYTSFGGPMTATEITTILEASERRGRNPEQLARLRNFLESDTGDDFVMVNVIEFNDPVPDLPGMPADASADDLLSEYMAYMFPALLSRASHPIMMGEAAAPALDIWGLEGADNWTRAALMRYRSRRDMIEIAGNPEFLGPHEYKVGAMQKTLAFPVDPWTNAGDPRFILALILIIIGQANSLRWTKRS